MHFTDAGQTPYFFEGLDDDSSRTRKVFDKIDKKQPPAAFVAINDDLTPTASDEQARQADSLLSQRHEKQWPDPFEHELPTLQEG